MFASLEVDGDRSRNPGAYRSRKVREAGEEKMGSGIPRGVGTMENLRKVTF